LAPSGCGDDEQAAALPEPIWQGEHVRFRTNTNEPLCGGTLGYMDGLVPLLAEALAVPVPPA
jgi:hypothetical protein